MRVFPAPNWRRRVCLRIARARGAVMGLMVAASLTVGTRMACAVVGTPRHSRITVVEISLRIGRATITLSERESNPLDFKFRHLPITRHQDTTAVLEQLQPVIGGLLETGTANQSLASDISALEKGLGVVESREVQTGEGTLAFAASENSTETTVVFPKELQAARAVVTANGAAVGFVVVFINAINKKEMKVRGTQPGHTPTGTVTFYWMAR